MSPASPVPRLAVCTLLALASAAAAEPAILPPGVDGAAEVQAFARTDTYRRLLAQAMARVPGTVIARCPKLVVDDGVIIPQQKLQFAPDGSVTGGAWRHTRPVHGCGQDTLANFFFYAAPDHRVLTVVGLPGSTRTDLTQQRDARAFILMALDPVAPGCAGFETTNTQFGGFGTKAPPVDDPGAAAEYRPWWETWTVAGCGRTYTMPMDFTPNRMGTQIVQPGGIQPH